MKEFFLRGKPIEELTQGEIDSLTWEEISSLFLDEETTCPSCDYTYTGDDVARLMAVQAAAGVPWVCPHCGDGVPPTVRYVHHMQELVTAWVDLVRDMEWLAGVKPEMKPQLEAAVARARAEVEEQLGPTLTKWFVRAAESGE